jgi:hypothetical protein
MKKIFSFITLFIAFTLANAQTNSKAETLLNEVSKKMSAFENMYIKFNYVLENKEVDIKQETNGIIYTQADKYNLSFMDTSFIYDGTNTYVIANEDEEVNIIDGSSDEDMLNPTKLLFFYKEGFTYLWQESKTVNGKPIQNIKLTPIDTNSESSHFILEINTDTKIIVSISEVGNNSTVTTFKIQEFKANQDISKNLFIFDESKYRKENYTINK